MRFYQERRELVATAQRMSEAGLTRGTSGNVSVRVSGGFLLTPTGMAYGKLSGEDMVEIGHDGRIPHGQRTPSSEWRLHRDVYAARADIGAIVHAHPMYATTLACLRKPIPAVHYMIAVSGREVPCAPYATFGTEELSSVTVATLGNNRACLMANHGLLATGESLTKAFKVAADIEELAEIYWRALSIGQPHVLDDGEMDRVIEKFRTYGQQKTPGPRGR